MALFNRRKNVLKVVKEMDAFPKIPENYVESTTSGGTISIVSFILIAVFVVSEFRYYTSTKFVFKYAVDTDYDSKLKINIDITVAMPCDIIGADILDVTNQPTATFGQLKQEPAVFELSQSQKVHWDTMQHVNTYIREEFHALQHLLWKTGYTSLFGNLPRSDIPDGVKPDACRVYGTLVVNKVSGNFHITAGKSIPYPRGHAHLAVMSDRDYNFSHRIERLSFGDAAPGIVNPLDAEEKITHDDYQVYHYYIQVVPTDVDTRVTKTVTYQYSVSELMREINHMQGSHGVPGIFFKYDMSSVKVKVKEEHQPMWKFAVRVCGIVGGIYVTSGILNSFIRIIMDVIFCRRATRRNLKIQTQDTTSLLKSEMLDPAVKNIAFVEPASMLSNAEDQ